MHIVHVLLISLYLLLLFFFFFFFQAEDGIRYLTVTGVQTCALPISPGRPAVERPRRAPGPPLTERGAPRAAARPRGRAAGGRRGSGPVGARRRGARLRPVRRAVPTERVDKRCRTGRWRVPRGPGDPGSERFRELARRRTGAVASAGARGPGAGGCGGPGPRGRGRGGSRGAPRGRSRPHVRAGGPRRAARSEEHTSELQSQSNLVCRLLLEKKNTKQ